MENEVMEYFAADRAKRIDFTLDLTAPEVLDQAAFIILVKLKFNGEISGIGAFQTETRNRLATVVVAFPNYQLWGDARAHCSGHLDNEGRVNASYRGALQCVDPGLKEARALLADLRAKK